MPDGAPGHGSAGRIRAFIAMPLPQPFLDWVANLTAALGRVRPAIRWARPESLHLTLAFLGEIPEEELEKLGKAMLSIGDSFAPLTVRAGGLGAFPGPNRPRVVWLGLQGGQSLAALQAALTRELRQRDLAWDDKPFKPHLTLARLRQSEPQLMTALQSLPAGYPGSLLLDRLVLYESRLTPQGAVHLPRRTVMLSGSAPGQNL
ncbi:RNA 2',3'-cyclic phosphodiesterase [Desulfuromonas sp. CSMB_57]|jgi:2'-5' RNA ligase|uniref:RNA 2',3'-cyclic phosphodiesterase n=1 Tax=Desulfuromonas sp. CSMB_57 TaxID=2807629 RepID=UPI001CD1DC1C|nr:RNA 2',3'-cyclic phosphodiesterase [Desulfuromonas sp. CSMB_57]